MKEKIIWLYNVALDMLTPLPHRQPMKLRVVKSILWVISGIALAVAIGRFANGLGSATALTDRTPWGLWVGFDVFGGVALAAGGFVIAATVYIFHLEKYHPILRPAVLTAFLGYGAVIVGLLFDLGLPWNIWHATIYWNFHSPLFEVAWCVMLYFTVLFLEFTPVVLEKSPFNRLYRIMRKATLPLVILGIMLSTLHQSSLGTLTLIMPFRLHGLWYTQNIPWLFFISAIALGLCMVIMESTVTSWLYERKPETELMQGLAKAARYVLSLYALLRFGDLAYKGKLGLIFTSGWDSFLFITEISLTLILPLAIFFSPLVKRRGWLTAGAMMVVIGFVLNRINVSGLATVTSTGTRYFPSWTEFMVSIGIVSASALVFFFFVERFHVYETEPIEVDEYELPKPDPVSGVRLMSPWNGPSRQYSLLFVLALAFGFLVLPEDAVRGAKTKPLPALDARLTTAVAMPVEGAPYRKLSLFDPLTDVLPEGGRMIEALLIDGNRDGRAVLFDHKGHQARQGQDASCGKCHHMNKPYSEATPCYQCHADMYSPTDIFNHDYHVKKLGGNSACAKCHTDPSAPKTRETATQCIACHNRMRSDNALVKVDDRSFQNEPATGYMNAMHRLCLSCHKSELARRPELSENFARCALCHEGVDMEKFKKMGPYTLENQASR